MALSYDLITEGGTFFLKRSYFTIADHYDADLTFLSPAQIS